MADLIAEKINSLIIERANKEILYAKAKEKLNIQKMNEEKLKAKVENEENNSNVLRTKVKKEVLSILNMILDNSQINILKEIDTKDEFINTIEMFYNEKLIDEEEFNKVKNIIDD